MAFLCAGFDVRAANGNLPATAQIANGASSQLSHAAKEVVKMTTAGVSEAVVKAYVDNAPSMFNVTADQVIYLQGIGVPQSVIAGMLTRDGALRDNTIAANAAVPAQPMPDMSAQQQSYPPQDNSYNAAPSDQPYYSDLAPYGDWNYVPDYGWGWQPSAGLGYDNYPWGYLGGGYWCTLPGSGLCWFPNGGFNRFSRYAAFRHFNNFRQGNNFNRVGTFGANRFTAGFRPSVSSVGAFRFNRSFSPRGFNAGVSRFSTGGGSHFGGGTHFSGGAAHFGGGGAHSSGGGNGHR